MSERSGSKVYESLALAIFVAATFVLGGCKTVPEGRSAVNEIQVRGADKVEADEVIDKIATTESSKLLGLFRGVLFEYSLFDRFVLQRDLARVEAFYRSKGYYDVHARAGRIHHLDNKHVRVEIVVEEGQAVVVRSVHIDGLDGLPANVVSAANAAAVKGLPVDKPFVEEDFKTTEGNVRRALSDSGYAYAKVTSDAAVDLVTHKVDVVMTVTSGAKCTFGEVRIEGLGELPEGPIRRTIDITRGKEYSQKTLEDSQQALLDLGVFASVEIVPDLPRAQPADAAADPAADPPATLPPGSSGPAPGPPIVPILVKLEPSRLRTIKLGGGLEFDALKTDVHGIIGWENRNFFGG